METLINIVSSDWYQVLFKLVLVTLFTGSIGLERSSMNKPAGFGTHAIIGVSATLTVIMSEYMAMNFDIDAARIPAQVLTGIGFIGAGTIIRDGFNVKGITTAAGIFAVTCIGLTVGAGYYVAALIAAIITFLLISYSHDVSDRFDKYQIAIIDIEITKNVKDTLVQIEEFITNNNIKIMSIKKDVNDKKTILNITIEYDIRKIKLSHIIGEMMEFDNIDLVQVESSN